MNLSALFIALFLLSGPNAFAKKPAFISGYDQLVLPGEMVELSVKAEKAKLFPFRTDIKKQKIEYFMGSKFIGSAKTDSEGISRVKLSFDKLGLHTIASNFNSKSKYEAEATDNRILVATKDQPILVTDIDHTIADISGLEFLRTSDELIPELTGASKVLNRVRSKFLILYLTARDDTFIRRTKFWLDFMNFPKGPSFFWDFGFFNGVPRNHGEYKRAQISKLKSKHNIVIGVGDKPHDISAYRSNGLRAYYIGLSGLKLAPGTIKVKSWLEIEKHLLKHPVGSLDGDPSVR